MANISVDASSDTVTGTSGSDSFTGVAGNYIIYGAQTLAGGDGDDFYAVSGRDIKISETPTGGTDNVTSLNTYVLPPNVENLTVWGQSAAFGNDSGNYLVGYTNNEIDGGKGDDILVGGAGAQYQFEQQSGHDTITNWSSSSVIRLNYGQFTSFADVERAMVQDGNDVVINLDAQDSIRISNTHVGDFTAANFQLPLDTSKLGAMTFDDEFNTLSTGVRGSGTGTWDTEYQGGATTNSAEGRTLGGNGEQELYVDPNFTGSGQTALGLDPFSINNGVLTITESPTPDALKSTVYGYNYVSGMLSNRESFAQTYGYFEAKMELPQGSGVWPAFWLMRQDGTWPPELDVMEAWGSDAGGGATAVGTAHTAESGAHTTSAGNSYIPDATTAMHTYGILWTPETLTWYIDGVAINSIPTPADMHSPMYMNLNLAISPGATDPDLTSQLSVDYVHAYSLADVPTFATGRAALSSGSSYMGPMPTEQDGFNAAFYAAHNLDVAASGQDMLTEYEQIGKSQGRAAFDSNGAAAGTAAASYKTVSNDSGDATMTGTISHDTFYLMPGFDTDTIAGFDIANDHLNASALVSRGGMPTFTDMANGAGTVLQWSTGETVDLLGVSQADARAVISSGMTADVSAATAGQVPWGQVIGMEDGFNAAYYAAHNPDVVASGMDLLKHYEQYGKAEGRLPYDPTAAAIDLSTLNGDAAASSGSGPGATTTASGVTNAVVSAASLSSSASEPAAAAASTTDAGATAASAYAVDAPSIVAAASSVSPGPASATAASPTTTATASSVSAAAASATTTAPATTPAHADWGAVAGQPDGFNAAYYAAHNLDVVASGMDLLTHYEEYGKTEGRAAYDTNGAAADTAAASYLTVAGPGSATLTGTAAHDTFYLAPGIGTDTIQNFDIANDHLNVSALIAKYGSPTFTDLANGAGTAVHWSGGETLDLIGVSGSDAQQAVLGAVAASTAPAATASSVSAAAASATTTAPATTPAHADWGAVAGQPDGFNAAYYAAHNLDVVASGMDLLTHYEEYGKTEGRAAYDTNGAAADTAAASYLTVAGPGSATLTGTAAHDTFYLAPGIGTDTIQNFDIANDHLNVSALIAKYGSPTFTDLANGAGTAVHWSGGETVQLLGVSNADAHHAVLG